MRAANTEVFVAGPYASGDPGTTGIDTAEDFARLPDDFSGGIWSNRIDRIAPMVGR
jgi:glycerophosphoryl diester phosphodiesterase